MKKYPSWVCSACGKKASKRQFRAIMNKLERELRDLVGAFVVNILPDASYYNSQVIDQAVQAILAVVEKIRYKSYDELEAENERRNHPERGMKGE